jgi:GTP-binding protein Era
MEQSTDNTLKSELDQAHEVMPVATDTPLAHSGYVAVIGRPNVGKSTLMNRILGEKIAIVSPKPQTTRLRQLGIYTTNEVQIIFVDTPGIHQPRHKLGEFMVEVALEALRDADVIVFVVEAGEAPVDEDKRVAGLIKEAGTRTPVILALNKIDQAAADRLMPNVEAYRALVPDADWTTISAKKGDGVDDLVKRITSRLPSGPQFYPEDQLSDTAMRDIAAEVIREKILCNTEQEIPHAAAVEVIEYKERSETLTYIGANIYVERDSQKGIIVGKGGAMLKKISTEARIELEKMTDTKVFLELWVKVLKNWRRDESMLRRFGYRLGKKP